MDNEHKKHFELLYSIIAVCFIIWVIVFFQIKSTEEKVSTKTPLNIELTDAERFAIMNKPSTKPPNFPNLTDEQRRAIMNKPAGR